MFESAELGHTIDKAAYDAEVPGLREALLDAQYDLSESNRFATIILIGGVDGAGKGETVNKLTEWMDPRYIQVAAFGPPTDEERERPEMWRFWRALPPKGRIGILFGSWYTSPILHRVLSNGKQAELVQRLETIRRFEQMLTNEGVLLLKFWFHLSKKQQRKRLKELESDPKTRWRVTDTDWRNAGHYDKFRKVSEHSLRYTSSAEAPWVVVEGADERYRNLTVGRRVLAALRERLDDQPAAHIPDTTPPLLPAVDGLDLLNTLDYGKTVSKKKYADEIQDLQGRLNLLCRHPDFARISVVCAFEGHDAAGKGGSIRRITHALDARHYQVIPIAAPTDEEKAQPYLWRFWRHLPRLGRVTIFDRTWYGRVLVERVEGYCSEVDWMRAYMEINEFEEQLVGHNTVLVKYWLAITEEEQLKRFKEREQIGFKRFKITAEDWRNRDKWKEYQRAVCDVVDRTSSDRAPWTLVEANDKYYARIKILTTLCDAIEAAL